MNQWDIFISHASEDKKDVALPLAQTLKRAGLKVWLDEQEIRLGDSLRQKIEEGLARSRFGVVILSPYFLSKSWTQNELNGLMAIEANRQKVIIPIWHEIDQFTLARSSPILADRLAANTKEGIDAVAAKIIQVVLEPGSESPSFVHPNMKRRFIELLQSYPDIAIIKAFLNSHAIVIKHALGDNEDDTHVQWSVKLNNIELDLCVGKLWRSTSRREWTIVIFGSPAQPIFGTDSLPAPSIEEYVQQLVSLRNYIRLHSDIAQNQLLDINPQFQGIVVAGRRSQISDKGTALLRDYNDMLFGIRVRSYDWIIDTIV